MPRLEIRAIKAKKGPNWKVAERILRQAMKTEVEPLYLKWHNAIVKNWNVPPTFKARSVVTPSKMALDILVGGPGKDRWFWTDKGTRPHPITPKGNYPLKFNRISYPKTTPFGGFGNRAQSYGQVIRAMSVHHPGTRPRNFVQKVIKPNTDAQVKRILNNAMQRATRAAWK